MGAFSLCFELLYLNQEILKTALIFGSVITDEFNEESDVDLAILSDLLIINQRL